MSEVEGQAKDTAPAAQQSNPEIEIVDTPVAAPEAEGQAQPAQQQTQPLYFGKYRSLEDAEKAYSEAQRLMHEKAQEAAAYRKVIEERQAPPAPAYQEPPVNFGEKFREQLAEDPFGTLSSMMEFHTRRELDKREAAQREVVKKYQSFSSRPEYADVAQEVAAEIPFANQPIDPIEALFLRKKLAKMEALIANGGGNQAVAPPFVESASGARRAGTSGLRVELDPDTAKLRGWGSDKMRENAKIVAKMKSVGGDMREMTIDDWEKAKA